jgi:hypothetical protein
MELLALSGAVAGSVTAAAMIALLSKGVITWVIRCALAHREPLELPKGGGSQR